MFTTDVKLDDATLLQGDVIQGVHFVGAINPQSVSIHQPTGGGDPNGWSVQSPPRFMDAMVLSHSCEVDQSNKQKVTGIIVAPLRDINTATDPKKVEELKQTNNLDEAKHESYLKFFVVEANEKLEFQDGAVVDFSKCFSLRKQAYEGLLEKKILQCDETTRTYMARKLALYFFRTQDIVEVGTSEAIIDLG